VAPGQRRAGRGRVDKQRRRCRGGAEKKSSRMNDSGNRRCVAHAGPIVKRPDRERVAMPSRIACVGARRGSARRFLQSRLHRRRHPAGVGKRDGMFDGHIGQVSLGLERCRRCCAAARTAPQCDEPAARSFASIRRAAVARSAPPCTAGAAPCIDKRVRLTASRQA